MLLMGTCELCPPDDNQVDDHSLADLQHGHLPVVHPEALAADPPKRWPDGGSVIVDMTEPDFLGRQQ